MRSTSITPPVSPRRVVVWGTYDVGKPRVRLLLEGLKRQGVEVITCHRDVWGGIEDKSQVKGVRRWLGLVTKALKAYPSLVWRYWRLPSHDAVLLGYPGMVDLLVLWPWAKLRKATLAWDWFLSAYDTVVLDRKLLAPPASHGPFDMVRRMGRLPLA